MSVSVFTHVPLHFVRPVWQLNAQFPSEHTSPAAQAFPHAPQFAISDF